MTAMTTARIMRTLHAETRTQWRAWLQDNCDTADEVWLVVQHANSATPSVGHKDAVQEALCFGWIDSLTRKRDAESRWQRFTPRKPRSAWSNLNRDLAERLTMEGLMTPHGQVAVDRAKRTGTWSMLADAQNVSQAGDPGMDRPGQATRDPASPHRTCRRMRPAEPPKPDTHGLNSPMNHPAPSIR